MATKRSAPDQASAGSAAGQRRNRVQEVRDLVLAFVEEHRLGAGDRLPTESELASRFGVGRSTLREALKSLEQDGTIIAQQGRGRFLSAIGSLAVERPLTRYESVTEMLQALGMSVATTVLSVDEGEADAVEAEALAIAPGSSVIRTVRLRSQGDEALMVNLSTIPRECLPGPLVHRDWSASVTTALAAHGNHVVWAAARITATDLPPALADRFQLGGLGPWLLVEERCVTAEGRRVLYAQDYYRGGSFAFQVLRRR